MPRRKGYVPTRKRIKLDKSPVPNKTKIKVPRTQSPEPDDAATDVQTASDPTIHLVQTNPYKYLHKKFKKLADIAPDSELPSSLDERRTSNSSVVKPTANEVSDSNRTTSESSSDEPQYSCPYCDLVSQKASTLQQHMLVHTANKPHSCLPCGLAFKTRSNLYKHYRAKSHLTKMEETGGECAAMAVLEEALREEEQDELSERLARKWAAARERIKENMKSHTKSIYKPKFHSAAFYTQNEPALVKVTESLTVNIDLVPSISPPCLTPLIIPNPTDAPSSTFSPPSPEFLHKHINKLISDNQAIVANNDPFWPKRNHQDGLKCESKLANALLQPRFKPDDDQQPLNLTLHREVKNERNDKIVYDHQPAIKLSSVTKDYEHHKEAKYQNSLLARDLETSKLIDSDENLRLHVRKASMEEFHSSEETDSDMSLENSSRIMNFIANSAIISDPCIQELIYKDNFPPSAPVRNHMSIIEHICKLCDQSFDNYEKMKDHIFKCCGRGCPKTQGENVKGYMQSLPSKANHSSPGPLLGNTPLVNNYQKLLSMSDVSVSLKPFECQKRSVPSDVPMSTKSMNYRMPETSMKPFDSYKRTALPGQNDPVPTSLKSLEKLSNAPMKQFEEKPKNDLRDDIKRLPFSSPKVDFRRDDAKIMKTRPVAMLKPIMRPVEAKPEFTKPGPFAPKITQNIIPIVQNTMKPMPISVQNFNASPKSTSVNMQNSNSSPKPIIQMQNSTNTKPVSMQLSSPAGVVTILHGGKAIPFVPGMPGPQTLIPSLDMEKTAVVNPRTSAESVIVVKKEAEETEVTVSTKQLDVPPPPPPSEPSKFARPSFLPLTPGTFAPKKLMAGAASVLPLVSPETPRPNKSYGQLYIGGNAYTYLGLKCSSRNTFCTLLKSQPTYVALSPHHNKVSMYSNWKVRTEVNSYPPGITPVKALACYDSRQRYSCYTISFSKPKDAVTHSSCWSKGAHRQDSTTNEKDASKVECEEEKSIKICVGGVETSDDYTYVRGRGRGKYLCLECGIRCKKPSMLKKHIRTHTDVRPYTCKHCVFSFKTKGNLTKHMKSKAHYKKCVELGIMPVPTTVDESNVDQEILLKKTELMGKNQENEDSEEEDDEDDDEDDEDDDNEEEEEVDDSKLDLEQEVARSLLSLSKMSQETVSEQYAQAGLVPLNSRPKTYPYSYSTHSASQLSPNSHTPTLTSISEQKEREKVSKNAVLAKQMQTVVQALRLDTESGKYYFNSTNAGSTNTVFTGKSVLENLESNCSLTTTTSTGICVSSSDNTSGGQQSISNPLTVASSTSVLSTSCVAAVQPMAVSAIGFDEALEIKPVPEPELLATICSTIDKLPPTVSVDPGPSVMLQTYLKECAAQGVMMKQQYISQKVDQREFDLKYNIYTKAFHTGIGTVTDKQPENRNSESPDTAITVSSPKRKKLLEDEPVPSELKVANFADKDSDCSTDTDTNALSGSDLDKMECASTSVNLPAGSPTKTMSASMYPAAKRLKSAEFFPPIRNSSKFSSLTENGRSKCAICEKEFNKPSQLRLHVNIHYFEQPFRCEPCAVSFRTRGHLHKHLSSNAHLNKINVSSSTSDGLISTTNPRPFKCDDCGVGFRIHGHLAKHLRSKMHIMKLECLGKLPFGTYAEIERCGVNLNDIDTSDCDNSLESLQRIAKGVVGEILFHDDS